MPWYPLSLEFVCEVTLLTVINAHVMTANMMKAFDPLWYWPPKVEGEDDGGTVFDFIEEARRRHYTLKIAA